MFWLSILPIIALPVALGQLIAKDPCPATMDMIGVRRLDFSYAGTNCDGDKVAKAGSSLGSNGFDYSGDDMQRSMCAQQPAAKSIMPGGKDQPHGIFCLVKYDDKECNCVKSSEKYDFRENVEPECIKLDDDVYAYHQWHRTCDEFPDCPKGCSEPSA